MGFYKGVISPQVLQFCEMRGKQHESLRLADELFEDPVEVLL